ncbi:uncharacterized protein C8A04DRAFT_25316 [Dichotomopilus funicola]|uniref:Fragile site-associated protein C-terminal domain-containing protein n=1 Tax=Dichotomopilus funicola TaxID=1934379 RepID=A0AAN6V8D4_9PEZI|nr:hypothetical protein C8A04DRAFT_25316 [Dichotomopilus funicola]
MPHGGFFSGDGIVFHPPFLGILVAGGILSVFSLLYFNRVFASIVSWGIRTYTWHQYGVYIDIKALQISLLAGRIFFTGLRYHGNNETILVQNGHITWAYWLRRVRDVNVGNRKGGPQETDVAAEEGSIKLPCRVKVTLRGLEWFIYNRSPAYDSILSSLADPEITPPDTNPGRGGPGTTVPEAPAQLRRRQSNRQPSQARSSSPARFSTGSEHGKDEVGGQAANNNKADLPLFLQLLPIYLTCDKAAIVMGNENTKAILILKTTSLTGDIDATDTETVDPYRQYFRFKFKNPMVEMKDNMDFREEQADRALRDKQGAQGSLTPPKRSFLHWQKRRLREGLRDMVPFWNRSVESVAPSSRGIGTAASQAPGSGQWQGLSRYLSDDVDDQKSRWASAEYGAVPTILDSPEASLTIMWDVVGKVGPEPSQLSEKPPDQKRNINGADPPVWAINLSIHGGSINYGPWADRHRADLQRIFAPSLCKDAVPAQPLAEGVYRMPTQFKFYVELTDATTLRVPVREPSKNWRWKGKEPAPPKPRNNDSRKARRSKKSEQPADLHQRPCGWLDLKVPANTTASYSMDMTASSSGYTNTLDVDLPSAEVTTSINHELLLRSKRQKISCHLSTPLGWNALRQWRFDINSDELELYILRDHVFLLIDLVDDWTSGPPSEYLVFTPFKYHINLEFPNIRLFLNLNDANIVNNPTDLEDNTYLIISSPLLTSTTCIPIDQYRPSENAIPFDIRADTASVDLHLPPWNTLARFLKSKEVGRLENLVVDGAYHYNATTSPANTDTLVLNISGQSPVANLHGFTIRYFLMIKDNYFGDDIHFRTLEEYQDMLRLKEANPDAELTNKPPPKKSNDLDVILSIRADDPKVLLPANLYSAERHIQIDTASLCLDLRFTNYYMDMDLVVAPLNLSLGNTEAGAETPMSATSSTQLFIDGLNVYGHRLFGLPPAEPTYMCNWDLSLGAVTGECTTEFLTTLSSAGQVFAFTFDDDENALTTFSSIVVYDVTFLRVFVRSVRLWLHVEDAAFLFSTGAVDVHFNDWARSHYSRRAEINIPDIKLSCLSAELATRHKARLQHHVVEADALVETSVKVAIIGRKANFSKERKLQQDLIRKHDQRTQRSPFLILPELMGGEEDDFVPDAVDPPAQCVPPVPLPVRSDTRETDMSSFRSQATSSRSRGGLRHASSFLSLSSTAPSSVVMPFRSSRSKAKGKGKGKSPEETAQYSSSGVTFGADGRGRVTHQEQQQHARELSPSTRHSAFYSMPGEQSEYQDASHNTVAFSSQYFAPYFPLENTKPSHGEAMMMQSIEKDSDNGSSSSGGPIRFELGDVDPNQFNEEFAYSSVILELPAGVTAFCNPTSLRYVGSLFSALQQTDPEYVLDSLQMDSMKQIFDAQKDNKIPGRVSDMLVKIPHLHLRMLNGPPAEDSFSASRAAVVDEEQQDQYDVSLTELSFTSRSHDTWEDAFKPQSKATRNSFHLRLDSAQVSATERIQGMDNSQAAALVRVDSILASMGNKDVTYFDAEIGGIHGSTSSGKVDYLASLVHRTGLLTSELGPVFSEASSQEKLVVRSLVHRLVAGEGGRGGRAAPDPSFLIRPSAILRSARQHLRTFDSWKLAMRLRQIWTVLEPSEGEQIRIDSFAPVSASAAESRRAVVAAFEKWRSWDLNDIEESMLLNAVFGWSTEADMSKPAMAAATTTAATTATATAAAAAVAQDKPMLVVVKIKQFQLALNPGPKQNEITFVDLTARVQATPAKETKGADGEPNGIVGSSAVVNVSCEEAAVGLNWELCELADNLLVLMRNMQQTPAPDESPSPVAASPSVKKPAEPSKFFGPNSTIHCVLSLGHGSVLVETVNLLAMSFSDGGQASILVRKGAGDDNNTIDTNLILKCDSVMSSLRSHQQKLGKLTLDKPSVFVSHELRTDATTDSHTVKAAASNQHMSLVVKQDPVTLAEVVDLVVRDEFAQLYKLKDQFLSSPEPKKEKAPKKIADRLSAFRVNAALFMDQYLISVPLLPSLTYAIHGTVSRAAIAANFGKEIIFDFDVKENSHDMQVRGVNNVSRSISLLQIPPTNGRIRSHTESTASGEQHSVSLFTSVELVQLDASAVYSLLSALNRPEISSVVDELQQQVKVIQEHLVEVTGDRDSVSPSPSAGAVTVSADETKSTATTAPLAYAVHLTLAGLQVFGNSPLKSDAAPLAHISFALSSVHLGLSNRLEQHGPVLVYPEFNVNLRRIAFEIQRGKAVDAMTSCGNLAFGALISASSRAGDDGKEKRFFHVKSDAFELNLSPDTISTVVDVLGYMGDKIKDLDTSRELGYLRKLRQSKPRIAIHDADEAETVGGAAARGEQEGEEETDFIDNFLSSITYSFEVCKIQIAWLVNNSSSSSSETKTGGEQQDQDTVAVAMDKEDLVVSLQRIELGTRTRNSARLALEALQVQIVGPSRDRTLRSPNSALLPEIIFNVAYVSTADARRLAFQAVGKPLDVRLTSGFIIPAAHLSDSISLSVKNVQQASQNWNPVVAGREPPETTQQKTEETQAETTPPRKNILGGKRLESLLIDADFAGAVVHLTGKKAPADLVSATTTAKSASSRPSGSGRSRQNQHQQHQQVASDDLTMSSTTLKSPGLAWKLEFTDNGKDDPSLHAEVKIDASSNILYPSVVPLVVDISDSVKKVVSSRDDKDTPGTAGTGTGTGTTHGAAGTAATGTTPPKLPEEDSILTADPTAVLGRMKLNLGLRICKQEFSLSCQPIARVAATASFEDVYFTANTVRSMEQGNFFAISGAFTDLQASVQHVYSRESTGSFKVQSIVLSFLNSKHLSGTSGVSAILKVSPMEVSVNAKQLQDFLLFREIWLPRSQSAAAADPSSPAGPVAVAKLVTETSQGHLVQRYQQVAATAAFPWTASISISALKIVVDLGQALGRSTFSINDFWVSSKKTSDWEQNLCLGFGVISIESVGRMSGFITLKNFQLRTAIEWPEREQALNETPLVQASVGFSQFRVKAAFDYQAFLFADITSLEFLMYNIRRSQDQDHQQDGIGDRLVASLDGEAVQVFGTTSSAAQAIALYQAFQRLVQERKANFEISLREIERYMQRKSVSAPPGVMQRLGGSGSKTANAGGPGAATAAAGTGDDAGSSLPMLKSPISLDTDVVVTLKSLNLGVFPSTFTDHQVFKMEALNAQARFAASVQDDGRVHSVLGLTLGQLRIGLAEVRAARTGVAGAITGASAVAASSGAGATGAATGTGTDAGETGPDGGASAGAGGVEPTVSSSTTATTAATTTTTSKIPGDLSVEDVVQRATGSRGGTILKVPRVEAVMQTWQRPDSKRIEYIFKSAFEGKVEVGWNYSRISYIRGMWSNHARTLAQTWGRELPNVTAIRVTGVLPSSSASSAEKEDKEEKEKDQTQTQTTTAATNKITAEVKVPQSKYEYHPLEAAVIETPQLRDMGEATPPLEWIGLNRDRLPNLTHQIVIVTLLELAGEVEDAYSRILGST